MPFERHPPLPDGPEGSHRLLLLTALVLSLSLFLAGLSVRLFPKEETATLLGDVLENEAVSTFLGLTDAEA